MPTLDDLPTPCFVVDVERLQANIDRMAARAARHGVRLRPHVKTHKCLEIGEMQRRAGARGITVATLYEARIFAHHGFDDILWAFPVILNRLGEILEVAAMTRLALLIDSHEAIDALESSGTRHPVWLKVDCGYRRAGVDPTSEHAVQLATRLAGSPSLDFEGILTHSGQAYQCRSPDEAAAVAETERSVMAAFAARLTGAGVSVPQVSVGSTPASSRATDLAGVSEIRPGNYVFHDRMQVEIGSCEIRDCAATILTSVVSSQPGATHCVIDAGALALSKDPGNQGGDPGFGAIFADYEAGTIEKDLHVSSLSQEHGILDRALPVGTRLRLLPNHSCLTAAHFEEAVVVRGAEVVGRWRIWSGRSASPGPDPQLSRD